MIRLQGSDTSLAAFPADEQGRGALRRPLHRLFLRSALGGQPNADDGSWDMPWSENRAEALERLFQHLDRYSVAYEADPYCQEVLRQLQEDRAEYESTKRTALSVKRSSARSQAKCAREVLSRDFIRELTIHQLHAVQHLLAIRNGGNFSVPGSGKTSVALAYFGILREKGTVDALLVAGPVSSFEPWEHEFRACFGRPPQSVRIAGRPRSQRAELYLTADDYEMLLTSYHTAARDADDFARMLGQRRYLVILDESHHIKRPVGGKIADAALRIGQHAERRLILTGTPMPNGLPDLWSQLTFLWPRNLPLGAAGAYLNEVGKASQSGALANVRRRIDPFFFRTTKRQLGLPKPSLKLIKAPMEPLQARIYRGVAVRLLARIEEAPDDKAALREWRRARMVRLLQIASNPTLLKHKCDYFKLPPMKLGEIPLRTAVAQYADHEMPGKVKGALSLANTLCDQGRKVIIWSTFVHNLTMLKNHLVSLSPVVIHGGVPYKASYADELTRESLLAQFRDDENTRALIANPAACAESISLHTACHDAIYLDRTFNCAHYLQSRDRIHRLGLPPDQSTTYYVLIASDTIDDVVNARLKDKMRNMRSVVEGDLPGRVAGYWDYDLGDEEELDFDLVESHIREVVSKA